MKDFFNIQNVQQHVDQQNIYKPYQVYALRYLVQDLSLVHVMPVQGCKVQACTSTDQLLGHCSKFGKYESKPFVRFLIFNLIL